MGEQAQAIKRKLNQREAHVLGSLSLSRALSNWRALFKCVLRLSVYMVCLCVNYKTESKAAMAAERIRQNGKNGI